MRRLTAPSTIAIALLGALLGFGCDSDDSGGDCRRATDACAPGFVCVQTAPEAFSCIPDDGADLGGPGGQGGQGGQGGGQGGQGGQGGGQGGEGGGQGGEGGGAVDDFVDLSNIRIRDAEEDPAGDGYFAWLPSPARITFDFAIRARPACESCRAQLVVVVNGEAVQCLYDDSPGLGGVVDRVDGQLAPPAVAQTLRYAWVRMDAPDCADALAGYRDAGPLPGGDLGVVDWRNPVGPFAMKGEQYVVASGRQTTCHEIRCDDGLFAVSAGGYFGGNQDRVVDLAIDDHTWRRCIIGERDDAPEVPAAVLQVACAGAPHARIFRVEESIVLGSGAQPTLVAACPPGSYVLGGGAAWPPGWQTWAMGPGRLEDGTFVYRLHGRTGDEGTVTVQATCASDLPEPIYTTARVVLQPGGQCGRVDCPEGTAIVGGGVEGLQESSDPDNIGTNNPAGYMACVLNNQRAELPLDYSAICLPR